MLKQASKPLDPGLVVGIVAEAFESIMPQMKKQMDGLIKQRIEAQPMNPVMKAVVKSMNDKLVGQMFARTATVMRSDRIDGLRGIKEECREPADLPESDTP